ncbi:MAG: dipeptidase [Ignavibacteriales bacterium]|nr:dipeptidase [Ignavibacteriales bacterium]
MAECNRLGMIVDISHASEKSFFDVLAGLEGPDHRLPLERAGRLRQSPQPDRRPAARPWPRSGGVIQICFLGAYVKTPPVIPERETGHQGAGGQVRQPARPPATSRSRAKAMAEREAINLKYPQARAERQGPRRPHRPRQEGRRHRFRRYRDRFRRRRRGRRLRRRQRHDPCHRGARPPRLRGPGDREDLGRQLLPRLRRRSWPWP